jgi:oligoribonuclease (3'-5' exoribonuclease)
VKYLSFDIETTGTEVKAPDRILMLSAVVEDTSNLLPLDKLPHFTCFVAQDTYKGEAFALALNAWILKEIAQWEKTYWKPQALQYIPKYKVYSGEGWTDPFLTFLKEHFGKDRVTMAGKNVGTFDFQFLPPHVQNRFRHRMIDPGSLFCNFDKEVPPSLDEICQPLGMTAVTHDAYEDALKVIEVIRRHPRFPNLAS